MVQIETGNFWSWIVAYYFENAGSRKFHIASVLSIVDFLMQVDLLYSDWDIAETDINLTYTGQKCFGWNVFLCFTCKKNQELPLVSYRPDAWRK